MNSSRLKTLKASKMLTKENIKDIKYLLKHLGDRVLEQIGDDGTELFKVMENSIGAFDIPNNLDDLCGILGGIDRVDIVNFLKGVRTGMYVFGFIIIYI